MRIEFFFDCSSPYTYLGFENIQPLAAEFGAEIVWRPILVGGVFNQVNPGIEFFKQKDAGMLPQRKVDYMLKDLGDRALAAGVKLKFPPSGHPVNSVKVMRACIVLEPQGKLIPFARAAFQAYFGEDRLISDDAVIVDICKAAGVDPDWLFPRIAEQSVKDALRANVDEVIARGGYGSPTYYLNGTDMYFGDDRLPLLRKAMERARAAAPQPA
ncbi:MAG: 2-hydroxychromene-2-carboxylate isomerase [Phenylobacterium sp.]|uniref:2-hydroxychromene-2-carboxylate isomerase n=1 Tax=Phenylobacterium sp. TaxID=1871053 RepID=UPI002733DF14|nr:2-hydroxychromene-2-carboxylate isomerase [Phenylobacterium sp.]MDP3175019.1 2-hydroxychromene-2-carboxylate isomerase [Phenylobacterium sp.]